MKHSVTELEGALLDAAVAKALGYRFKISERQIGGPLCFATVPDLVHGDGNGLVSFEPSTDAEQCMQIITREQISLLSPDAMPRPGQLWGAKIPGTLAPGWDSAAAVGPTPLVAAMRVLVKSKFGDEVDLP